METTAQERREFTLQTRRWPRKWTRITASVLMFTLICLLVIPEYLSDLLDSIDVEAEHPAWSRIFNSAFWYQPLLAAGVRTPRNHYVRLVTLSEGVEPQEIFTNVCRQRLFMARLLTRLEKAKAAIIVIDKWFNRAACPSQSDLGTKSLLETIASLTTPIVVGVGTVNGNDPKLTNLARPGRSDMLVVSDGQLEFPAKVRRGLIRLHRDNRRIPLQWPTYEVVGGGLRATNPEKPQPTLSRVAAELYDENLPSLERFQQLVGRKSPPPYTGFLPALPYGGRGASSGGIPMFSALELICGAASASTTDWENCAASDDPPRGLRNRVVVIGNANDANDRHYSVLGKVPGAVLQANYIESLLDDRYLKPVPLYFNAMLNVLAGVFIGCLFFANPFQRRLAFSTNAAAVAGFTTTLFLWVLSYFVALHVGYYLAIWFPWVYVLGLWGHGLLEKAKRREEAT